MWCYQKPGFEAQLLTELQKQQQQSQFCDIVLRAEGVSVPAHSCILSAISPPISSALSSKPVPPVGQRHLLEFPTLRACTLLHMVRLIYSGEMAGEGENEKQEAISAAAKLGIHGLVEVTNKKSRGVGELDHYTEVGVQTEPLRINENEERCWRWRREVRDGEEVLSNSGKDIWTQTEELHLNTEPPDHQAASYETIDVGAFQSLGQPDSHEFVPITFVYPPAENQMIQPFSAAPACVNKSTGAEGTSITVVPPPCKSIPFSHPHFSSQADSGVPDSQSCWAGPQGAGRDVEAAEEREDECFEQFQGNIPGFSGHLLSPDNTKATHRGRARQGQRAGVGGARRAGTGEPSEMKPQTRRRRRGGCTEKVDVQEIGVSKMHKLFLHKWGLRTLRTGQGGGAVGRKLYLCTRDSLKPTRGGQRRGRGKMWESSQSGNVLCSEGRGSNTRREQKDKVKQRGLPAGRTQTSRDNSTQVSLSAPHEQSHNVHALSASSHSLQMSPPHSLLSPATSYLSPASSLLHTTPARPLEMLSHEDQPEQIDRLLEEVMMELDFLPNNNHKQQQCEGELTEMLENFLQSFEHHVHGCSAREEKETDDASSSEARVPHTDPSIHNKAKIWTRASNTPHLQDQRMPCRQKRVNVKKPESKTFDAQTQRQLQQIPVVKLERRDFTQQGQSLGHKSSSEAKTSFSAGKTSHDNRPGKNKEVFLSTNTYLIRSRFKQATTVDGVPSFDQFRPVINPTRRRRRGRLRNSQLPCQSVVSCGTGSQLEKHHERREEEMIVRSQEEAETPAGRGEKRRAERDKDTSDDAIVRKKGAEGREREQEDCETFGNRGVEVDHFQSRTASPLSHNSDAQLSVAPSCPVKELGLERTEKSEGLEDEDINVVGGSSPAPEPVIISWSSEVKEDYKDEDVDVVGE